MDLRIVSALGFVVFVLMATGCGGGSSTIASSDDLAVPAGAIQKTPKGSASSAELAETFGAGYPPAVAACIAGFVRRQLSPPEIKQAYANAAQGDDANFEDLGRYFAAKCRAGEKPHP